jgi:hypothetical protein
MMNDTMSKPQSHISDLNLFIQVWKALVVLQQLHWYRGCANSNTFKLCSINHRKFLLTTHNTTSRASRLSVL